MEANYTINVRLHCQQFPILLYIPINTTSKTISNKCVGVNEISILCHAPISKTTTISQSAMSKPQFTLLIFRAMHSFLWDEHFYQICTMRFSLRKKKVVWPQ